MSDKGNDCYEYRPLEGRMVRCPIQLLQSEFKNSEQVRNLFVSYSETLLSQVQQTVACNITHTTEERMCHWLLMMHARAEGESLKYTHEFLANILGTNRKSVTLAAQCLRYHLANDRMHKAEGN
jgi:CRP-like cAMP-binding protein